MAPGVDRLSNLPQELKDEIFDLVLCDDGYREHFTSFHNYEGLLPHHRIPHLLKTSRLLRDEGSQRYLSRCVVTLECGQRALSNFTEWLNYFGPLTKYLRNIRLRTGRSEADVYRAVMMKDNRPFNAPLPSVGIPLRVIMPEHDQPTTSFPRYHGPQLYFGDNQEPYNPDLAFTISQTIRTAEELTSSEDFLCSISMWPEDARRAIAALQAIARHSSLFSDGKKMHIEAWTYIAWYVAIRVNRGGEFPQMCEDWMSGRKDRFEWFC